MITAQLAALAPKMCTGRHRYGQETARTVAEHARAKTHRPVCPYRCACCGGWHVGLAPSMRFVERLARALRGLPEEDGR